MVHELKKMDKVWETVTDSLIDMPIRLSLHENHGHHAVYKREDWLRGDWVHFTKGMKAHIVQQEQGEAAVPVTVWGSALDRQLED